MIKGLQSRKMGKCFYWFFSHKMETKKNWLRQKSQAQQIKAWLNTDKACLRSTQVQINDRLGKCTFFSFGASWLTLKISIYLLLSYENAWFVVKTVFSRKLHRKKGVYNVVFCEISRWLIANSKACERPDLLENYWKCLLQFFQNICWRQVDKSNQIN